METLLERRQQLVLSSMSTQITLEGRQVGRFRASILLFKESFRFMWSDKEMLFVPILALLFQLFLIGMSVVFVLIPMGIFAESQAETTATAFQYGYALIFYVICAFTVAYSQAVITHIVYTRMHEGDATLWDGIKVAGKHTFSIFLWACITSTVGLILRAIAERSQLFVKIFTMIVGAMWSVLTYFTVVAIVVDNKSVFSAIGHSGTVFKRTWGETLVSNISLSLVFMVSYLVFIFVFVGALFFTGWSTEALWVLIPLLVVMVLVSSILSSVLSSVLRTLLYVYASEGVTPANFNKELLEQIHARKIVNQPVASATVVQ